jgi:hypothetical protein
LKISIQLASVAKVWQQQLGMIHLLVGKADASELRQNVSAIGVHLHINRSDTAGSDRDPCGVIRNFYP